MKSRIAATLISAAGLSLIAGAEGLRNYAYKDPVGIPTICYGHTANVNMGDYKTTGECLLLLKEDAKSHCDDVLRYSKVPLTQGELDAYCSFTYNVGATNFRNSTLLKKLNREDRVGACNELSKWVYADGKILRGLVTRREEERQLCLSGAQKLKSQLVQ